MVERKMAYNRQVEEKIDKDQHYTYLTTFELPLVEATVYHLVHDQHIEKIDVATLLGLSISRVSHAYKTAEKKIYS